MTQKSKASKNMPDLVKMMREGIYLSNSKQSNFQIVKMEERNLRNKNRAVTSNKTVKTITVARKKSKAIIASSVKKTTKFHAHDEKQECAIAMRVIMETRPPSKTAGDPGSVVEKGSSVKQLAL